MKNRNCLQPVIHAGYTTTGASWLRRCLFNIRPSPFQLALGRQDVFRTIIQPTELNFDPKTVSALWEETISKLDPLSVPVVSHERLCGSAHSGGYDSAILARRLKKMIPEAKIIIVIKRQEDMLLACYDRYVRHSYGSMPLYQYVKPIIRGRGAIPEFSLEFFHYHKLLFYYEKLFKKNNLLVLPFELILENPRAFIIKILQHSQIEDQSILKNVLPYHDLTEPISKVHIQRLINRLFISSQHNLFPFVGWSALGFRLSKWLNGVPNHTFSSWGKHLSGSYSAIITEITKGQFGVSNYIVAERFGIDLGRYNYQIA